MNALVAGDRSVLDDIGAYDNGSDPYLWTHDYGRFGEARFVLPPGEVGDWRVGVLQVDDQPGLSQLYIEMWTAEEGASDLSLEMNLRTGTESGLVRGEFIGLHVM